LSFYEAREQNDLAIGKRERVVMDMQPVCVHLSKAGHRGASFRFASPGAVAKTTLEFDVIVERDLCSGNEAHRDVWLSDCGEAPRQAVGELCCHQPVTDLGRPSGDVLQTVVTHGDDLLGSPPRNYQSQLAIAGSIGCGQFHRGIT
jgi:hypothetical protein